MIVLLSLELRISTLDFWRLLFTTNGSHDNDPVVFLRGLIQALIWWNYCSWRWLTALHGGVINGGTIGVIRAAGPNRAHPLH